MLEFHNFTISWLMVGLLCLSDLWKSMISAFDDVGMSCGWQAGEVRSSLGVKKIRKLSNFIDFHWFSLFFIDFHWFSLIFIGFHWFSLIFVGFQGLTCPTTMSWYVTHHHNSSPVVKQQKHRLPGVITIHPPVIKLWNYGDITEFMILYFFVL